VILRVKNAKNALFDEFNSPMVAVRAVSKLQCAGLSAAGPE